RILCPWKRRRISRLASSACALAAWASTASPCAARSSWSSSIFPKSCMCFSSQWYPASLSSRTATSALTVTTSSLSTELMSARHPPFPPFDSAAALCSRSYTVYMRMCAYHWPTLLAPYPDRFLIRTPWSLPELAIWSSNSSIHSATRASEALSAILPPLTCQQMPGVPVMSPLSLTPNRARRSAPANPRVAMQSTTWFSAEVPICLLLDTSCLLQPALVLFDDPVHLRSVLLHGDGVRYVSGPDVLRKVDVHLLGEPPQLLAGWAGAPRCRHIVVGAGLGQADAVQLGHGLLKRVRRVSRGHHRNPLVHHAEVVHPLHHCGHGEVGAIVGQHEPVPLGRPQPPGTRGRGHQVHVPPAPDGQQLLLHLHSGLGLRLDLRSVRLIVGLAVVGPLHPLLLAGQVGHRGQLVPRRGSRHVQDQGVGLPR